MRIVNLYFSRVVSLFCALLCAFMLVGCSDKAALESVDYVLHNAQQEPIEALERIRSIDKSSIRGKHNRARYALAYSEALYYNCIDSDCDTLVRPLFEYYHDSDNHEERARALYQYALLKYNSNQFTDALFAIEEAHKSLDNIENYKLRGLLYRTEGYVYGGEMLFQNAIESQLKSKECFELAELPIHRMYTMFDIGRAYFHMQEFQSAIEYVDSVVNLSILNKDNMLLEQALGECCDICLCEYMINNNNNWLDRAKTYLEALDTMSLTTLNKSQYYCHKAVIESLEDSIDNAYHYIDLAEKSENPDTTFITLRKYWINKRSSNFSDALYWFEKSHRIENTYILTALKASSINYQLDSTRNYYELERQKNINNRLYYIISTFIIVALGAILMSLSVRRSYNQRMQIEQYEYSVRELKNELAQLHNDNKPELAIIFNSQYHELNNLLDAYYEHIDTPKQQSVVFTRLQDTINSLKGDKKRLKEVEKYVNLQHDDIMLRLRTQCPQLNERDLRIALYSFAGLSLRAIAIFLDSKPETISKVKYKIKTKIKSSNSMDAEEFINKL